MLDRHDRNLIFERSPRANRVSPWISMISRGKSKRYTGKCIVWGKVSTNIVLKNGLRIAKSSNNGQSCAPQRQMSFINAIAEFGYTETTIAKDTTTAYSVVAAVRTRFVAPAVDSSSDSLSS
ncbi:unnamed protein product [Phytophthora fragariaefolia]|uniref:Unnamed protein product n=1 Tax=Phytophthora fragariaefolia TaxID=1490495 RepID=A0A9W7D6A8_9STRA|nr:unnamed protein product [Phytophthora fragariaefolia]